MAKTGLFENIDFGVNGSMEFEQSLINEVKIDTVSVESLLKKFKSAVGLDISMTSTGLVIWENGVLTKYQIKVDMEVDLNRDELGEEKMQEVFATDLLSVLEGRHFEVIAIENVFGGQNFDTVRKLLALNSVMGRLILQGKVTCDKFFKRSNKVWKKYLGRVYRVKGAKDKINIEEALIYMNYDYALENCNLPPTKKEEVGYQDILDATGLLCGLAVELEENPEGVKFKEVTIADVKTTYIGDMVDLDYIEDKMIRDTPIMEVELDMPLEKRIVATLREAEVNGVEDTIYAIQVPNTKLGAFGSRQGIPFLSQGYCVILFYHKAVKTRYNKSIQKERKDKRECKGGKKGD